jgi:hypothetical protein
MVGAEAGAEGVLRIASSYPPLSPPQSGAPAPSQLEPDRRSVAPGLRPDKLFGLSERASYARFD